MGKNWENLHFLKSIIRSGLRNNRATRTILAFRALSCGLVDRVLFFIPIREIRRVAVC